MILKILFHNVNECSSGLLLRRYASAMQEVGQDDITGRPYMCDHGRGTGDM